MWTPRRIILCFTGLILFCGGFAAYSSLFGWIDGLPPLPEAYSHARSGLSSGDLERAAVVPPLLARMRQAFGPNCIEQSYGLKFEAREKGLLFAAAENKLLDDGRMQLQQVSVAVFGKSSPEISTIHADRAFLTFDQPVRKIEDMGSRKIVYAELHSDPDAPTNDPRKGKVHISNNRKTLSPDDDIFLKTPGPIYYHDDPKPSQPHIWTPADIELIDRQSRPTTLPADDEPQPPTVTGTGMRVFLTTEQPPPPGAPPKKEKKNPQNPGGVSGVERIELDRNVRMNIWSESKSMVGGGPDKNPPKQPAAKLPKETAKPEEKVLVQIQTNGPFYYDMLKDFAHFEVPAQKDLAFQEYVKVTRRSKGNNEDTLTSDYLDVQFTRHKDEAGAESKSPPKAAPPKAAANPDKAASPQNDLEIATVHAWGKNIAVSSDQDSLFAFGNDLYYDARIKRTVMKGLPMHAVKDGNLIRCPELVMCDFDDPLKQHTLARGPGSIGMGEIDPKTQEHSQQAHWQDRLELSKVKENGRLLDLIVLTGGAYFLDTANEQRLAGMLLRVWLLNYDDDKPAAKQPPKALANAEPKKKGGKEERKQAPYRVEAIENVSAHSPDLIVHAADYLNVWFKDLPPRPAGPPEKLPGAREVPEPKGTSVPAPSAVVPAPAVPAPAVKAEPVPALPGGPVAIAKTESMKKEPAKKDVKDPPIELRRARRVETWVNRIDGKNELDKVHTEGNVYIHQDKTPGSDRDVDIVGHTVDLENHPPDGNYLIVTGNRELLGEVHFDKISIVADDIRIDQRDNTANVKGPGSMRLLSKTDTEGKPLDKPTWIDIYWQECMALDGPIRSIRYEGAVQAKQLDPDRAKDTTRTKDSILLAESMQVWLDRPLYLNQSIKTKEPGKDPKGKKEADSSPKIDKIFCDRKPSDPMAPQPRLLKPVFLEDVEKLNGNVTAYKNVQGIQVEMDNTQNKMIAYGPGEVRIFQAGAKDPLAEKKDDPKKKDGPRSKSDVKRKGKPNGKDDESDEDEMKLTWVKFDQRMIARNVAPKRSVFFNDVEVVHMPASRFDVEVNIAKLPARAMYIHCNQSFEVVTRSRKVIDKNGKEVELAWQEMIAIGNVRVRNDDFAGSSKMMTYSEDKSLVVFTGTDADPAVMTRVEGVGLDRKTFRGEKILYNTKTKDFSVDGSIGGQSN